MLIDKKITREHLHSFLKQHETDDLILNLGSGHTDYSPLFPNAINCDISKSPITHLVADAHTLPFRSNSFSQIVSTEMLEHTNQPDMVVKELYRILKPEGKIILTTRFMFPVHDAPTDLYRFTRFGLEYLFREFSSVKIIPETTTKDVLAVLLQRIAFQAQIGIKFPIFNYATHLLAHIVRILPNPISIEYGDITRKTIVPELMTSGYYVVAYK